ncbi:MAG: LuxR C-terminal-related transcriptional regulator, partial [Acidimicrobiales bacterium]
LQVDPGRLDQRGAVLEIFRGSLESAATRGPLLVLLDDLQWADQATIAALGWLPEQLFSYPIVWLLARRPLPSSSSLEALVTRLEGAGAHHWHLEPLDQAAALELAGDVAGRPLAWNAQELLRVTGGNPLFIVVAIQAQHARVAGFERLDHPDVDFTATGTEDALQALIGAHVRSLSQPTVELLKVASVLGQEFAAVEASELSGRPSAQLLSAIEEAMTAGVLVEAGEQVAFRHDLFRQILYTSIPGSLRRSLHSEAAAVLRRNGATATRLAHQLMIGAEAGDRDAITSLYEAVGELAGTSPWAAADLALRLVDLTAPESEDRTTAVSMTVQLLGWAGRSDEACVLGERFLETSSVSAVTEAEIHLGIRRALASRQSRPYPRPLPERVFQDPAVSDPVRANLLALDQIGQLSRGDLVQADVTLERAAALLAGAGNDLDAAAVRPLWVLSAALRGDFVLAVDRACQDLRLSASTNGALGEAISASSVAHCLCALGRIQEGLEAVQRATEAAESCGYPFTSIHCRCIRAALYLETGRLEDARAEAAVASDAALDSRFLSFATLALTTLVESSVRIGDLEAADGALRRLTLDCEGEAINPDQCWAAALLNEARGRGAVAMRSLQPVFAALDEDNFAIAARHPGRLSQLVGFALRQGREDAARLVTAATTRLSRSNHGVPVLDQVAVHARGLLERDTQLLCDAYAQSLTSETRLLHTILAEDLGSVQAEQGRRSEAVGALEEAFASFSEMGAQLDAARVRTKLRRLGVRKRQAAAGRPERGWASLTPAEVSVANLVAKGLTNRAAAEELCVSPDTINTHLRHAFAKLDIRSRIELARLVAVHDS